MIMSFRFFDRYSFNKLLTVLIRWQNFRNTTMNLSILFKKSFQHAALVSAVTLAAFGVSNSFAASSSADSNATVIEPIAITKDSNLAFGQFAPGAGGDVIVSTSGARTTTNPILSTTGNTIKAAQFTVSGANDATFSVSITNTVLTETVSGTETMALATFSDNSGAGGTPGGDVTAGTLSPSGAQSIYLGGTLTVGASQTAGAYTGTVSTVVEYN
jgi:hypothetical protein